MMSAAGRDRATIVFDGECGFCRASVDFANRWVRPRAQFVPWQHADLASLGLTAPQCASAVQWVDRRGVVSGGRAVARALLKSPMPWPILGALAQLPILDVITDRAYVWVADHRPLLSRWSGRVSALPPASTRRSPRPRT